MEWNKKILRFKFFLFPLALFYQATIFWRNLLYNYRFFISRTLPTKIISVGNITSGGTGKTPMVIYLAEKLKNRGKIVAILSRGYGRKTAGTQLVTDGQQLVDDWRNFGDEPTLMAEKLKGIPIVVDENRYRGGLFLVDKFKPDVIILDDGFQHRSLERDIDIVLLNSHDEQGDYKLIPYGKLREPIKHLKRADILILTKTNITSPSSYLIKMSEKLSLLTIKSQIQPSNTLYNGNKFVPVNKNKRIIAVSALGDPRGFHKTLEQMGLAVVNKITFLDHHDYVQKDIDKIIDKAKTHNADIIVTTEKDLVKLKKYNFDKFDLFSLGIQFQIESKSEKELFNYIEKRLSL